MRFSPKSPANFALALVLALTLSGCSDDDKNDVSNESEGGVVDTVKSVVKKTKGLKNDLLTYVPADTILFAGTGEPTSQQEYLAFLKPGMFQMSDVQARLEGKEPEGPGGRMLFGLYARYMKALNDDPASLSSVTGVDKDWNAGLYTVEVAPVLRIALEESATFEKFVKEVETEHSVTAVDSDIGDFRIRRYELEKNPGETAGLDLVIANDDDYAVVTLQPQSLGAEVLEKSLGITKPSSSVVDTGVLNNLVVDQGFSPAWIGFLDHQQIFEYVSDSKKSEFVEGLKALDGPFKEDAEDNPFTDPVCRKEYGEIVARWPRSVFGYTKWEPASDPMILNGVMRIETTNTEFLDQLKTIQGKLHMPKTLIDAKPALVMGLGVDIDAFLPFVRWLGGALAANAWQCESLAKYAESFSATSGPALGMAGVMLSGIKGATLAVLDAKASGDPNQPVEVLDAVLAVNTSNPGALVTMLMSAPFLGGAQLSTDGTPTPIALPFPQVSNIAPMLVVKDSAVALFAGDRAGAVAESLDTSEPISSFLSMQMDYGKQADIMMGAMQAQNSGTPALTDEQLKAIESLKSIDAEVGFSFEVGDGAIELGTQMQMQK